MPRCPGSRSPTWPSSGNVAGALEALRYALDVGVPHVVIADALADGVRTIARVASAGRASNEFQLANRLGMPPWKVKRAQSQSRGWTEPGVRQALHGRRRRSTPT